MKSNKVHIQNPCHEDWNKMTPKDNGRHCSSCNKVVVDFTKMTNEEVINYLNKEQGCGYFRISQTTAKQIFIHSYLIAAQEYVSRAISFRFFKSAFLLLIGLFMIISGCRVKSRRMAGFYSKMPIKSNTAHTGEKIKIHNDFNSKGELPSSL